MYTENVERRQIEGYLFQDANHFFLALNETDNKENWSPAYVSSSKLESVYNKEVSWARRLCGSYTIVAKYLATPSSEKSTGSSSRNFGSIFSRTIQAQHGRDPYRQNFFPGVTFVVQNSHLCFNFFTVRVVELVKRKVPEPGCSFFKESTAVFMTRAHAADHFSRWRVSSLGNVLYTWSCTSETDFRQNGDGLDRWGLASLTN